MAKNAITMYIDPELLKAFDKKIADNCGDRSKTIRKLIRDYLGGDYNENGRPID